MEENLKAVDTSKIQQNLLQILENFPKKEEERCIIGYYWDEVRALSVNAEINKPCIIILRASGISVFTEELIGRIREISEGLPVVIDEFEREDPRNDLGKLLQRKSPGLGFLHGLQTKEENEANFAMMKSHKFIHGFMSTSSVMIVLTEHYGISLIGEKKPEMPDGWHMIESTPMTFC